MISCGQGAQCEGEETTTQQPCPQLYESHRHSSLLCQLWAELQTLEEEVEKEEEEEEFLSTFLPSSLLLKRRLTFDDRPSASGPAGSGTHIPEVEIPPHYSRRNVLYK